MPLPSSPISFADALAARERIAPFLARTPLRGYRLLDQHVGEGIRVLVKHENHQPTNTFKVRNGLSALTLLTDAERRRGVVAASTGNHGQGVAYAGSLLGAPVTICVPVGNNPEKNDAIRALGAAVVEEGADYDESVEVSERLARERGLTVVHSTNNRGVIAGAATMTLEILEDAPELDALVLAVGGGSQAVGALTVIGELRPSTRVYAVQAAGAAAAYESWRTGVRTSVPAADTFAEGIATRESYELTFPALRDGLAGFVTVRDAQLADAVRVLLRVTHNLVEGAAAAGFAGLQRLRKELAGQRVGIIITGGNIDRATLRRVLNGDGPSG